MLRVLEADDDPDLSRLLDAIEVAGAVDAHEALVLSGEERVPLRDEVQRVRVRVRPAGADGDMKNVDPRILILLEFLRSEELGVRLPFREQREVERQWAEHVDDERVVDEAHGALRVLGRRRREQPVAPEVEHWSGENGAAP